MRRTYASRRWRARRRGLVAVLVPTACLVSPVFDQPVVAAARNIVVWGDSGVAFSIPAGVDHVSIALGELHALALKADGTIVGWGGDLVASTPPAGPGHVAIAAGDHHSLALRADGSIAGWGSNVYGESTPPPGNDFVAIDAESALSLAVRRDGSLAAWGNGGYGLTSPPSGNDFIDVAAGTEFAAALRRDGSIVQWGLAEGDVPVGNDFVDISAGERYGVAIRTDGTLVGWGSDRDGVNSPPSGNGYVAVAAGRFHALALKADGTIVRWGRNLWSDPPSGSGHIAIAVGPETGGALIDPDLVPPDSFGEFTPLAPARILDTRTGVGRDGGVGPLAENVAIEVQVTGRGGVASSGVAAVVMNVTVTQPTAWSYLTVWPSGVEQPDSSNLNYVAGQTIPNHVTVAVGDGGRVMVVNRFGTAHVIFDVVGFYADDGGPEGSRYHSVDPSRLFDTRSGVGGVPVAPLGAAGTLEFGVLGKGGVPASGVTAVVMNVTVARATEWSYLTVFPGDLSAPPLASSLNYRPGQAVPNLVTVRVPANGVVKFYNQFGTVHVMADVVGYFDEDRSTEAGRFIPFEPYRSFDSRDSGEKLGPDDAWLIGNFPGFSGIPLGEAEAMVLNVTVTGATAWSYLSVFPSHLCSLPNVSNLNFVAGQTVPNQVVVRLGTTGGCAAPDEIETIAVYNYDGSTHVVIDDFGFYTAATTTLFE